VEVFFMWRDTIRRSAACCGSTTSLHTSDFILPTSFEACLKLFHTRLSVEVAIRAVWTNRVLPDDAGQISTRQIGTRQIGAMEVDAG